MRSSRRLSRSSRGKIKANAFWDDLRAAKDRGTAPKVSRDCYPIQHWYSSFICSLLTRLKNIGTTSSQKDRKGTGLSEQFNCSDIETDFIFTLRLLGGFMGSLARILIGGLVATVIRSIRSFSGRNAPKQTNKQTYVLLSN